ncbi:hypothetical protein ASPCAL10231 [Aspergillus calidoustus]|uniref:Uncharacterized protein n=1 Tax=Aspergillus calidoustus TaxID=454130 RepID=A0A0U5CBY3_ASPCI|nr:hypothetical protein ASPCAL10231 [Aspergillus calidoustus]
MDLFTPLMCRIGYFVEPTLKASIYNSIFSTDSSRPWAIPQYTCPSGNCTWDPVASLAVRALCADISSSIQKSCTTHDDTDTGIPFNNCTVSLLHDGASAFYAGGMYTDAIALQVKPVTEPVVYTNHSTLPVIQRLEAIAAVPEPGHYMAQDIRDDGRQNAGSQNTGSQNTGSQNTGSQNTGSQGQASQHQDNKKHGDQNRGDQTQESSNHGNNPRTMRSFYAEWLRENDLDANTEVSTLGDQLFGRFTAAAHAYADEYERRFGQQLQDDMGILKR